MICTTDIQNMLFENYDNMFVEENTFPVSFFYKLPIAIRTTYEHLYDDIVSYDCLMWIHSNKDVADSYMKNISTQQHKIIRKTTPQLEYVMFKEYYKILQPIIKKIVEVNNLYDKYPEYLI